MAGGGFQMTVKSTSDCLSSRAMGYGVRPRGYQAKISDTRDASVSICDVGAQRIIRVLYHLRVLAEEVPQRRS